MHQNLLCILIHILKLLTIVQFYAAVTGSLFFFFFSFLSSLSVVFHHGNQNSLHSSPGKSIHMRLQNKKRGNKTGTHSFR